MDTFKKFVLFEDLIDSKTAEVYHKTNSHHIPDIIESGHLRKDDGYYGVGIYSFLELDALKDQRTIGYGDAIVSGKVKIEGFLIDSYGEESRFGSLAKKVYGDNHSMQQQLQSMYSDKFSKDEIRHIFSIDVGRRFQDIVPGIIIPAKAQQGFHWVIIYNTSRMTLAKWAMHEDNNAPIKWQPMTHKPQMPSTPNQQVAAPNKLPVIPNKKFLTPNLDRLRTQKPTNDDDNWELKLPNSW